MHKHYIYRSDELIAVLSGDALVDMFDTIKEFIVSDINAQKNFNTAPSVRLSELTEGDEAVFVGTADSDTYTYTVKSSWQS